MKIVLRTGVTRPLTQLAAQKVFRLQILGLLLRLTNQVAAGNKVENVVEGEMCLLVSGWQMKCVRQPKKVAELPC